MKKILIVEDDNFLNKLLAYNLIAEGYDVTSVLNARTAAETIPQREFDLVVLDINLPDGNGFELCKLIKPQHPSTIVIFLTANDQESDQIRGYESGAVDYITKPFVIGVLQRKIKAMLDMLEHNKPVKDIYDDGRLFLDFLFPLFISLFFTIFALISKCSGSAAGIFWMREESPGNTGHSTSETRSYW